jgi:hypothetical protein
MLICAEYITGKIMIIGNNLDWTVVCMKILSQRSQEETEENR